MTGDDVARLMRSNLPPIDRHDVRVEAIGPDAIHLRLPFNRSYVGPGTWQSGQGEIYSGPLVMGLADTAMYGCVVAALGARAIPVMVSMTTNFLRPARAADLIAHARIVRRGTRLFYLECWLTSDGEMDPCSHVTATYRVLRSAGYACDQEKNPTQL